MEFVLSILVLLLIYVVLASSLNLIVGHAGLLSLSHAAFYGIGAYVSALAGLRLGWSFLESALAGAVLAAILAAVLALPLMRLRGDYFVLGSLGFQIIIFDVLYNWDAVTNGPWGLEGIPQPNLLGIEVRTDGDYVLAYIPLAALCVFIAHWAARAPFGRVLNAIREDEGATITLGKDVRWFRMRAFALASALAAVAGAMYAHFVTYIDPTSFTFLESVYILSLMVIGGAGNTRGPILGAVVLVVVPELLRFVGLPTALESNARAMIYGAMLIVFCLFRPKGLVGEDVF
jgi:branched-chain amino acid transport system permease protein